MTSWPATTPIGVIMLATRFPRPPGDIGHPDTLGGRGLYARVEAARVSNVVVDGPIDAEVVEAMAQAGNALVERGAKLLTTSCGFACAIHDRLQARLPVPLVSSALNLLPTLAKRFADDAPIGILTFDGRVLNRRHFGRFWSPRAVIQGIEEGRELHRVISGDLDRLDPRTAEADVLEAGEALLTRAPGCVAILLECTNLPPYRSALERSLGLPVFDLGDALADADARIARQM
ncbi:aspartate/glutamate racemase family protein [Halotalea alkalilenta]|uniref:aspartate/glutamate racemase family protein n=1 Tax=Halotalea alkalilenta TaxID=376489 RepID=UPI000694C3B3|nr:aspartate/glutamate racemase family protein [Halotalea alkalilenta]